MRRLSADLALISIAPRALQYVFIQSRFRARERALASDLSSQQRDEPRVGERWLLGFSVSRRSSLSLSLSKERARNGRRVPEIRPATRRVTGTSRKSRGRTSDNRGERDWSLPRGDRSVIVLLNSGPLPILLPIPVANFVANLVAGLLRG